MQNQEIHQALGLFDSAEKWQAFVELAQQRDTMKSLMYKTAAKKASAFFASSELLKNSEWDFSQKNPADLETEFFLKIYGPSSIRLTFGWEGKFYLRTSNKHDFNQAAKILLEPDFQLLKFCFERVDSLQDSAYPELLMLENFNFLFDSPSDGHFGPFRLAWYAHHETERFLTQIATKVARFQTPEATQTLAKLNEVVGKR